MPFKRPDICQILRRPLQAGLFAVLCGSGFSVQGQATLPVTGEPTRITSACFLAADDIQTPPSDLSVCQEVSLPDLWRARLPQRPPGGWYSVTLNVPADVTEIHALRFDRISWTARIYLNGSLLYEDGQQPSQAYVSRTSLRLVSVPPHLLRAGANQLLIGVHYGTWAMAGLSEIRFGPQSQVAPGFARALLLEKELPQALNLIAVAMAGVLLMLWAGRRTEVAVGIFGLLFLLLSFRNYAYFTERPFLPTALGDWMLFTATVSTACLFGAFGISVAGGRHTVFRRVLVVTAAMLPAAAAVIVVWSVGDLPLLRKVSNVWLLLGVLVYGYGLVVQFAMRQGGLQARLVAVGFGFVVLAAVHDYAYIQGWTTLADTFWIPYATPIVFVFFGLNLVSRLLRALREVEELTVGLEARVAQRTDELSLANVAKTRFLAAASHDLRQPLHAISLMVGLVRERISYPEVRSMVDKIQYSVDNMGSLLKGLLDISRLDAGDVRAKVEDVYMSELLSAVREVESALAQTKQISLRFAPCRAVVRTDRVLTESILRNLVANATRYTERGTVLVGARRRGGVLTVQVHDTGIGIAAEHAQKIFQEFYQVGNAARDRTLGLGLGLSIVQRTAALLGHPVRLRSRLGMGSTFEFDLPLCVDSPRSAPDLPAQYHDDAIAGSFVLIVEDDVAILSAMRALFSEWGCHVIAAESVSQALAELGEHLRQPDLLICDYRLGQNDNGVSAIERLRVVVGAHVPAVLVTGDIAPSELQLIRDTKLPVLFKPVRPDELKIVCVGLVKEAMLPDVS